MRKHAMDVFEKSAQTVGPKAIWRGLSSVRVVATVLMFCILGGRALAQDKRVGDTRDACDRHDVVKFEGKNGPASVAASAKATVELPSSSREIYWYCAGTRERSANDTPFNVVQITRAPNGAIQWVFFVRSESASSDPNIRVGDTKDACDRSQIVTIQGTKAGNVNVRAGDIQTADFDSLTRQISWTCGQGCPERSANSLAFNHLQLERAGNGALEWVFYRTRSVNGVGLGSFQHDVSGNAFLPSNLPNVTQPPAGIIKISVARFWDTHQTAISGMISSLISPGGGGNCGGSLHLDGVALSNSSQLELRVVESGDTLTLKPVIHGNQVTATIHSSGGTAHVAVTFDLEVVMPFPRAQTLTVVNQQLTGLTMRQPQAMVQHVEIEGNDPGSGFLVGLLKAAVRAQETELDKTLVPLGKAITDAIIAAIEAQLTPLVKNLPPNTPFMVNLDEDQVGDVRLCPALLGKCQFPGPGPAAAKPKVLDTSTDQCSQQTLWLWDSELGRFVAVPRGAKGMVVQLDDKRFEWYCGDNAGPDPSPSNEESASGPTSTSQVRISRDPTGRAIHWEFLFWR